MPFRNIKAEEKRDGGGQYNWGKATDVRSVTSMIKIDVFLVAVTSTVYSRCATTVTFYNQDQYFA